MSNVFKPISLPQFKVVSKSMKFNQSFTRGVFSTIFFVLSCAVFYFVLFSAPQGPYQSEVDPQLQIQQNLTQLEEGQKIMLLFGANWCPSCRLLEQRIARPPFAEFLKDHYRVVYVDIGDFDHNQDTVERYGNPTEGGIPAMAVLDSNGTLEMVVKSYEFAQVRSQADPILLNLLAAPFNLN